MADTAVEGIKSEADVLMLVEKIHSSKKKWKLSHRIKQSNENEAEISPKYSK